MAEHKISLYDPELNHFVPLNKISPFGSGLIPGPLVEPRIIMVRFKRRILEASNS
jgi:hypothetical protein